MQLNKEEVGVLKKYGLIKWCIQIHEKPDPSLSHISRRFVTYKLIVEHKATFAWIREVESLLKTLSIYNLDRLTLKEVLKYVCNTIGPNVQEIKIC